MYKYRYPPKIIADNIMQFMLGIGRRVIDINVYMSNDKKNKDILSQQIQTDILNIF